MGRDLRLYPKNAGKAELVSFIKSFDKIQTSSHLWDWPKGTIHFFWFDDTDYRSTTGVEITIYPVQDSERSLRSSEWAIHVRNTYSATWHDVEMLNRILRTGRKKFGGDIFGDYGKNRYAPLWDDASTPISRGFAWVYSMAHGNIRATLHALPSELDIPKGDAKLESILKSNDPSRVIYNGLVPFLISVLEFYLKNIFLIALKYDPNAQDKIEDLRREVSSMALQDEKGPEESIADSISFQDLRNVKKAFRKWLNVDIKKPLTQSETTPDESLWRRLDSLIKYRHDIIHRMGVDTNFSRTEFLNHAQLIEESLDLLLKTFAEKYQIDIEQIKD
jgi:hypothetical protein